MAKIAVIEDEEIVRRMVVQFLQRNHFEVVAFADAKPALCSACLASVDLILTDLKMPTRGEVLIELVRGQGIQAPIIVMSGYSGERPNHLYALGAQEVIRKPFELDTLLDLIHGTLC